MRDERGDKGVGAGESFLDIPAAAEAVDDEDGAMVVSEKEPRGGDSHPAYPAVPSMSTGRPAPITRAHALLLRHTTAAFGKPCDPFPLPLSTPTFHFPETLTAMAHFHSQFGGDEQDIAPSRQLISLLLALDSPAPAILANVLTTIRAAQLIAAVTAAAAAAANNDSRSGAEAAQAIHKLGVRINGLLSRSRDRHAQRAGFELAREWAEQGGWQVIAAHAQPWLATGLSALQSTNEIDRLVLHPILALLGEQLLGQQAAARPEYNRQVVTPNVAKFGTALIACAEKEVEQGGRVDVLVCTSLLHGDREVAPKKERALLTPPFHCCLAERSIRNTFQSTAATLYPFPSSGTAHTRTLHTRPFCRITL